MKERLYCSMDLHSNNVVIVVTDSRKKVFLNARVKNDLPSILSELKPFHPHLSEIAIESTYNWYWLADGLEDHGYSVRLVNTGAVRAYKGAKYTDDTDDALFLCDLQTVDRLPTGYVYPREERPIRDMLRRRTLFMRHQTAQMLSLQGLFSRQTGKKHSFGAIVGYDDDALLGFLGHELNVEIAKMQIDARTHLRQQIDRIEKLIVERVSLKPQFRNLRTIPGVGPILALTIMLEIGDISRFPKCGNFVSYCRCAPSKRISNGKAKGKNNTKNGNPYLSWAFIEAAVHAINYCPAARKYYDRKRRQSGYTAVAMKSLAAKLAKAAYFIMRDGAEFAVEKVF